MNYEDYPALPFERPTPGVLVVKFNRPSTYNSVDTRDRDDLVRLWLEVDARREARTVHHRGCRQGRLCGRIHPDRSAPPRRCQTLHRGHGLCPSACREHHRLQEADFSAINGPAAGAGLAAGLLAGISIIADDVRFTDCHLKIGVAAGDHATLLRPLLCGLARAKYYLLTAELIDGREAERIGLVSMCVAPDQLMPRALELAGRLAAGPQEALRYTKHTLNHWLRQAAPIFEASLAMEILNFFSDDPREGLQALLDKRTPKFEFAVTSVR